MTQTVVITETLTESSTAEEAKNEEIVDAQFEPRPPYPGQVPVWDEGETYAKGDLVVEAAPVAPTPPGEEATEEETEEYETAKAAYEAQLATYQGTVFKSQEDENKGNNPNGDTDYTHWAPAPVQTYELQNTNYFGGKPAQELNAHIESQHTYATAPPASSSATAAATETINPGALVAGGSGNG